MLRKASSDMEVKDQSRADGPVRTRAALLPSGVAKVRALGTSAFPALLLPWPCQARNDCLAAEVLVSAV